MLENLFIDEGPPTWRAGPGDITRLDTGLLPAGVLLQLPGAEGEEALFRRSPSGRMGAEAFAELVADLKVNGMRESVTVHVEQDGRVHIHEGNHRLRAAHRAEISVPVVVKYFGNVQRKGLVFRVRERGP
jgi:hypothetical protein